MSETPSALRKPWYTRLGPGLITACVVIGPGSILTSSSVGANSGYTMLWVVLVSLLFMQAFMMMGAKLGSVANESPADLIRTKAGKWLAILVGLSVFFICVAYQAGNNIAVAAVFEGLVESKEIVAGMVVAFNLVAIIFLLAFKDLYKSFERLMMVFVGLMLVSFAINLVALKPSVGSIAKGLIPSAGKIDLALLGLIGTTFVSAAAFYQAYLVQQKGWNVAEVKSAIIDSRVGSIIMALITLMLMTTAAAGLHTPGEEVSLANPAAVAQALEPTFGTRGRVIFCVGLFAAAYSSFLINAMIGGFMAADGFGLGSTPQDRWPRILTAAGLLIGMLIAVAVILLDFDPTPAIILAQAITIIVAPLIAAVLFWLTCDAQIMKEQVNGPILKLIGVVGLILLIGAAANTAIYKLPKKVNDYLQTEQAEPTEQIEPAK